MLRLHEVGLARNNRRLLVGLGIELPPRGWFALRGPAEVALPLGRHLTRERIGDGVKIWGETTVGGLDHRIRRGFARVCGLPREPRTVQAQLVASLPPEQALAIFNTHGRHRGQARVEALVTALADDPLGLSALDPDAIASELDPTTRLRLILGRGLLRRGPGLIVDAGFLVDCGVDGQRALLRRVAKESCLIVVGSDAEGERTIDLTPYLSDDLAPSPPRGFRWVRWGCLGGMSRPGMSAPAKALREYLAVHRVDRLIGLEETSFADALRGSSTTYEHFPIDDMTAPEQDACRALIERSRGKRVVFHCKAGLGRTGTLLGASLIDAGYNADQALALLRMIDRHYVQTKSQEEFLYDFAASLAPVSAKVEPDRSTNSPASWGPRGTEV